MTDPPSGPNVWATAVIRAAPKLEPTMTVDLTDAERRFIRNEASAFLESTEGEDDFAERRASPRRRGEPPP